MKSCSQEEQRLQVPRALLERTIPDLNEHVQDCVVERIFSLDAVRISAWADRETRKVVVPATTEGQTMRHAISLNAEHISVIARLSPAGESLAPYTGYGN
jgi:hypothetical protein